MATLGWIPHADEGSFFSPSPTPATFIAVAAPVPAPGFPIAPHKSGQPLTVALLVTASVIATCFLLLSYYAVILRRHSSLRRRGRRRHLVTRTLSPSPGPDPDDLRDNAHGYVWYIRTVGLDESAIESIPFFAFHRESGVFDGSDCSVCLSEFVEGELVRVLPKCGHGFHVSCIDTWLRSHVNCPLCRASVVVAAAAAAASSSPVDGSEGVASVSAAVSHGDLASSSSQVPEEGRERGNGVSGTSSSVSRTAFRVFSDLGVCGGGELDGELQLRRSVSMDSPATDGFVTVPLESEGSVKQGDCAEGDSSHKEDVEVERPASNSGGNSFLSRFRGRSSSVLPL